MTEMLSLKFTVDKRETHFTCKSTLEKKVFSQSFAAIISHRCFSQEVPIVMIYMTILTEGSENTGL